MNLFKHDLKSGLKSFIIWSVGIIVLIFMATTEFTGYAATPQEELMKMLDKIPKAVMAVFGMSSMDISNLGGYYSILQFYILICVIIFSILLGGSAISRESQDKTYEFICTKPLSRTQILGYKLLAALVYLVLFSAVIYFGSLVSFLILSVENTMGSNFILFGLNNFFVGLLFFTLTLALCSVKKKMECGIKAANFVFFATYIVSVLYDIVDWEKYIRIFTPFKYFLPEDMLDGKFHVFYLAVCVGLSILFLITTFINFNKKDLNFN